MLLSTLVFWCFDSAVGSVLQTQVVCCRQRHAATVASLHALLQQRAPSVTRAVLASETCCEGM
jgi:hypothetical protein